MRVGSMRNVNVAGTDTLMAVASDQRVLIAFYPDSVNDYAVFAGPCPAIANGAMVGRGTAPLIFDREHYGTLVTGEWHGAAGQVLTATVVEVFE
jgi:hypothetical protein